MTLQCDIFTRLFANEVIPKGFNLKWTLSLGSNGGGDNNINKKTAAELREESIKKKHKLNQPFLPYVILLSIMSLDFTFKVSK
jgi:hypothetical protein